MPLSHPLTGWDEPHHPELCDCWWKVNMCFLCFLAYRSLSAKACDRSSFAQRRLLGAGHVSLEQLQRVEDGATPGDGVNGRTATVGMAQRRKEWSPVLQKQVFDGICIGHDCWSGARISLIAPLVAFWCDAEHVCEH